MQTRFILINTSHAGNVGAAARAMKTMGFDDLVLVAPRWANVLRREETIQRASGALDVLDKCRIVDTLDEALDGLTHLCATAMTPRDFGPPTVAPREHFELLSKIEHLSHIAPGLEANIDQTSSAGPVLESASPAQQGIGFLFGSERFGMRNEDVYRCHACLSIPSNPKFGSLNIGAALQVIAYEWRLALGGFSEQDAVGPLGPQFPAGPPQGKLAPSGGSDPHSGGAWGPQLADAAQVAGMLTHLEQSLVALGFLDPAAPKKLMPRLNQLFNRAGVTQEEIHILRGIAKAVLQQSAAKNQA
nr:RNA methyltransferase [uncultured Rhodoferax sp.]